MKHTSSRVRNVLVFAFRRIVRIYFREVEIAGVVPASDTGGRIFAANHVNALVDPILVLTQAPCPISPVAKSTLWKIPGLRWLLDAAGAVPIVRKRDDPSKSAKDNDAVFERVGAHLARSGNILIFPEGTSHSEPHLLALRTGAGRMLAHARAAGGEGLTFQAVGLEFDARDVFRSRTLLLFGPVRSVEEVAKVRPGAPLAEAITAVIGEDLADLLVEGATWEERLLVVRAAEMLANDVPAARSLAQLNALGRRVESAREILRAGAADEVSRMEARVAAYWSALDDADTTDARVARYARHATDDGIAIAPSRLAGAALRLLTLPLALVGMLLFWLPYQLPRAVTRRIQADPDVTSTYKLGIGLLVHPAWAALLVLAAFLWLDAARATLAALLIVSAPFAALPWLDRWDRLGARLDALAPREERRARLESLAGERALLLQELRVLGERAALSGSGRLSL